MHRRTFLSIAGAALATAFMPMRSMGTVVLEAEKKKMSAIPILMFHKVDDTPRYPEDISTVQLMTLLTHIWNNGFCPVNMSDIIDGKVDSVVPKGLKPIGITADDAHRSIVFSRATVHHEEQRNARSLVAIFNDSLKSFGHAPRATLFLSRVGDDRYTTQTGDYFGGSMPLAVVLDSLTSMPGLEIGYHTCAHKNMRHMGSREIKKVMEEQMTDFAERGIARRSVPVLAYPYGVPPTAEGVAELRSLGFKGGMLAYPGNNEASYQTIPSCFYDKQLVTDPFHIPRVCVGAFSYAAKGAAGAAYQPINPVDDFAKDVLNAPTTLYVSQGRLTSNLRGGPQNLDRCDS